MKLANYVRRTALFAKMAGVGGLWLLQILFAYLSELENLSDSYQWLDALWYIIYRSPYFLVQFAPTGILLGAVVGLGLLANNSEIVIMRAAGMSLYRIIGWVMQPALIFVLCALAINQWLLPAANLQAKKINDESADLVRISGYWTVIANSDGSQAIVHVGYADGNGVIENVKRFSVVDGALVSALSAPTGHYVGERTANASNPDAPANTQSDNPRYQWQLDHVQQVHIGKQAAYTEAQSDVILSLPITKDTLHLLTRDPEDLSISELYQHEQLMRHQGSSSLRHRLSFWQKVLSPFSVLSLVLIACSFVFGSLRSQSLGLRIVMALLTGLLFSYLQDLAGFVALSTGWSPFVMALLPVLLGFVAGMWLLAKKG